MPLGSRHLLPDVHVLSDRLAAAGREIARGLIHLLFPGCCSLCGRALEADGSRLCGLCRSALLADPFLSCPRCAATVGPFGVVAGRCSSCREESFAFEAAVRLGPYDGLPRETVLRLKNAANEGLAELIGELWAEQAGPRLRDLGVEIIVPVQIGRAHV